MTTLRSALPLLVFLLTLLAAGGCNKNKDTTQAGPGPGDPGGPPSAARQIMMKIGGRGPQALTAAIGKELTENPPPLDKVQPQAKEYHELAVALTKEQPRKGSAESWQKVTADFSQDAGDLETAANAMDLDKTKAAHRKLSDSCMGCHQQHRGGPGPRDPGM